MRERRPGSWELRVYAGTDPETHRRRYRTATVHGNRAEARRGLDELLAAVRADRSIGARSPVADLLEAWFAIASASWAPTTTRQTRSVLDRYLHPHLGHLRVGEITPAIIDASYARLRRHGGTQGEPLSPGTLARIHVVLRAAFAQAVRWGWVWDNPAEQAHRIVAPPVELHPPTPTELAELLDNVAAHDPQLHVFLVVAAVTGARRAQLLGLRWANIDLARGRIAFCAGWVEGPQGPVLTDPKTKRRHTVDVDPTTVALLAQHRDHAGEDADAADGFVFSDDHGVTAWKPNRVTKAFARHRRAAGLREFRLHDLRHFMATEMLHAGVPIAVVARRLDHRRVSTTLDRYAHAVPGGDASAASTLRAVIDQSR